MTIEPPGAGGRRLDLLEGESLLVEVDDKPGGWPASPAGCRMPASTSSVRCCLGRWSDWATFAFIVDDRRRRVPSWSDARCVRSDPPPVEVWMKVGMIVPGVDGEYDGWDPARAWTRTVAVAHGAEALGFDSVWMFDHVRRSPCLLTRSRSRRSWSQRAGGGDRARAPRPPRSGARLPEPGVGRQDDLDAGRDLRRRAELGLGAG